MRIVDRILNLIRKRNDEALESRLITIEGKCDRIINLLDGKKIIKPCYKWDMRSLRVQGRDSIGKSGNGGTIRPIFEIPDEDIEGSEQGGMI